MAPEMATRIIGIRPGEKLHEVMCPADDSHLTLEFADHYVIQPTIEFAYRNQGYDVNAIGETGMPIIPGFEYILLSYGSVIAESQVVHWKIRYPKSLFTIFGLTSPEKPRSQIASGIEFSRAVFP